MMAFFSEIIHPDLKPEDYLSGLGMDPSGLRRYEMPESKSSPLSELSDVYFEVDVDGDGTRETLSANGLIHFGEKALQIINEGVPAHNVLRWTRTHASERYTRFKDFKAITVGDFNGDEMEDYLFAFKDSTVVYTNTGEGRVLSERGAVELFKDDVLLVPDYERTGTIHTNSYTQHEEKMSSATLQRSDLLNLPYEMPAELLARLPARFLAGTLGFTPPWEQSTFKDRITGFGFDVKDDTDEEWPQDIYETVVAHKQNHRIDFNFQNGLPSFIGGHVQIIKNKSGTPFVTIDPETILYIQNNIYFDHKRSLISFRDAMAVFGSLFGLGADQVLVMPRIGRFAHLDQQMVCFDDGKIIALKLPNDHPDHDTWQMGLAMLADKGFDLAGEIEIPPYQFAHSRSPLNMLIHTDLSGRKKYIIPVDPVLLYDIDKKTYFDLRTFEGDDSHHFGYSLGPEGPGKKIMAIYDPNTLPQHIKDLYDILLRDDTIEPDQLEFFYYNYSSSGSLHCRTNQDPLSDG
ncbi:MAG: hypothetical protein HQM16_04340 [Deltaproteobacteria bacterium]|nr:hypothetical protein [Deltaproteobacteria bacterium]